MATITLPDFTAGSYLVLATRKGIIKKTPLEQFERVRSTGIRAITIDPDDELAWVDVSTGSDDIIIATSQGKIARFHEGEIAGHGSRRRRRHRHPAGARGRLRGRHERGPAGHRPAGADRDRLRQARPAQRVPADAPRLAGRPADQPGGSQDRPRRGRPAGDRRRRGAAAHLAPAARSSGPTSGPSTASTPRPAASSRCASTRATGSWGSPRSVQDLRSRTAWATMAPPKRPGQSPAGPGSGG